MSSLLWTAKDWRWPLKHTCIQCTQTHTHAYTHVGAHTQFYFFTSLMQTRIMRWEASLKCFISVACGVPLGLRRSVYFVFPSWPSWRSDSISGPGAEQTKLGPSHPGSAHQESKWHCPSEGKPWRHGGWAERALATPSDSSRWLQSSESTDGF